MKCLGVHLPYLVAEHCPVSSRQVAYYTQIVINRETKIPDYKPPLENVIKVSCQVYITKLVAIPVRLDCGGISGCKVLASGTVWLGIEYSAAEPEQSVYFIHYKLPFQSLILGGPNHKPIPPEDCPLTKFNLHVCIELLQVRPLTRRTLENLIVLMLWLERKDAMLVSSIPPGYVGGPLPDISKEIAVNHPLIIPCEKPPVNCILDYWAVVQVPNVSVIETLLVAGKPLLPVRKVLVTGKVQIVVKYVAHALIQQIHAANFLVPFETVVEWPGGPLSANRLQAYTTIEHFQLELLEPKRLQKVLVIRLNLFRNPS